MPVVQIDRRLPVDYWKAFWLDVVQRNCLSCHVQTRISMNWEGVRASVTKGDQSRSRTCSRIGTHSLIILATSVEMVIHLTHGTKRHVPLGNFSKVTSPTANRACSVSDVYSEGGFSCACAIKGQLTTLQHQRKTFTCYLQQLYFYKCLYSSFHILCTLSACTKEIVAAVLTTG